ncbi:hypothetical protein PanWU01x14_365970, partial [Parasponia andersonii]
VIWRRRIESGSKRDENESIYEEDEKVEQQELALYHNASTGVSKVNFGATTPRAQCRSTNQIGKHAT